MPGIVDTWKALKKNEFNSLYSTDNNYSAAKTIFHKKNFIAKFAKLQYCLA